MGMVAETYLYDILSISSDATPEEISRAYKKIALRCHPDKTNHDPQLTERFKEITRAYEVLRDSRARNVYDHYGEAGLNGTVKKPSNARRCYQDFMNVPHATDIFSEVFNDLNSMFSGNAFEQAFGFGSFSMNMGFPDHGPSLKGSVKHVQPVNEGKHSLQRGNDIHHVCKVTLTDLYFGKDVTFRLPKSSKCSVCNGFGGMNPKTCGQCQGSGKIMLTMSNQFSQYQQVRLCRCCRGLGTYFDQGDLCSNCDNGYVFEVKSIKVKIPPGAYDGDKIILEGEADEGRNIIPGNLVIYLQEISHPSYVRKNDDLYMEHDLDLKTALLGGSFIIEDFMKKDNNLKVFINVHGQEPLNNFVDQNIQKGEVVGTIDPGRPKMVKGLGMPIKRWSNAFFPSKVSNDDGYVGDTYKRGNLFIKFNIVLPPIAAFNEASLNALYRDLPDSKPTSNSGTNATQTYLCNIESIPSRVDLVDTEGANMASPVDTSNGTSYRSASDVDEEPEFATSSQEKKRKVSPSNNSNNPITVD